MSFRYAKAVFLFFCLCLVVTMITLLIVLRQPVFSLCDCGYVVNIDNTPYTFREAVETDFIHLSDISANKDWIRQEFNKSRDGAQGPLGEVFAIQNIYTSPNFTNDRKNKESAGLKLAVQAALVDGMVSAAEIDTARTDMFYGSYRAGIKLSGIPGSCSAFFWYFSDTAEIDVEFLSKDYNATNNSYPINLILHDTTSDADPKSAKEYLPFNPTTDFHEYRIDFLPKMVSFFADNQLLARLDGTNLQARPGHLVLQHWSNGNPQWSGGPPTQDALMTVAYVKAYFNSSLSTEESKSEAHCPNPGLLERVCRIPEVTPDNQTATSVFFTHQSSAVNIQIPQQQYWSIFVPLLVITVLFHNLC